MLDTFLENPVDNPLANKPILEFFPSYAPTQFAAAGAFHHQVLASMAALSLAWTAAFALLGLAVLRLRLPQLARRPHQASGTSRQARTAAGPGTPLAGPDSHRATAPVTSPAPRPRPASPSRQPSRSQVPLNRPGRAIAAKRQRRPQRAWIIQLWASGALRIAGPKPRLTAGRHAVITGTFAMLAVWQQTLRRAQQEATRPEYSFIAVLRGECPHHAADRVERRWHGGTLAMPLGLSPAVNSAGRG